MSLDVGQSLLSRHGGQSGKKGSEALFKEVERVKVEDGLREGERAQTNRREGGCDRTGGLFVVWLQPESNSADQRTFPQLPISLASNGHLGAGRLPFGIVRARVVRVCRTREGKQHTERVDAAVALTD